MPAESSSQIAAGIGDLVVVAQTFASDRVGLLSVLAKIPDPRKPRGVRHRLAVVLGLAVCAVLAGARSYVAIAEWAADADEATLDELEAGEVVASESTFRRTLQRLDAAAFDDAIGAWAQTHSRPGPRRRRVIAVDGKTLRGSGQDGQPARHLLAALDHAHGVVLGQVDVEAKTNEIPMFSTLLDRIDLAGAVVTADAMHAQRGHADYLAGRNAHYVLTVKRNQPHLHNQLKKLPWRDIPVGHDSRDRGHGRIEHRTVKVATVEAGLLFPHAVQAIQIVRRRRPLKGKKRWSTETVYAITCLNPTQASPAELAAIIRGHWSIEDSLHWVRDMSYDEDRSQIRTHNGPHVMASLRNLAITILRLTGTTNITKALRHNARRPHRPLQTIRLC